MIRRLRIGVVGLLGLLGACASADRLAPLALESAAPQPVEALDWLLTIDGSDARLAYGVAASDDLRIAFECRRGSADLGVVILAAKEAADEVVLESGGDVLRLTAVREDDPVHGGVFLTARADAGEPVFLRFRRLGWLAVWRGEARDAHAAQAGSGERIERFFAFCG